MMKFKVTYEDGFTETYKVKPKHILAVERDGGGMESTVESTYKLAHLASDTSEDFEFWMNRVEDIEPEIQGEPNLPTIGE
jgi:hypothetical protein